MALPSNMVANDGVRFAHPLSLRLLYIYDFVCGMVSFRVVRRGMEKL